MKNRVWLMLLFGLAFLLLPAYASAEVNDTFVSDGIIYKILSEGIAGNDGTVQIGTGDTCAVKQLASSDLIIPSSVMHPNSGKSYSVKSIAAGAFKNVTALERITVSDSVKRIGQEAFQGCDNLVSIRLGVGIESIEFTAFWGCERMREFDVAVSNSHFASSDGVLFTEDTKTIVFYPPAKPGTSYLIPSGVENVGDSCFSFGVSSIRADIDGVTSVDGHSNLTSIVIPSTVKHIGYSSFKGCLLLSSITLPDSIETIDDYAFSACTGLSSIAIPKDVNSIGVGAFELCTGLSQISVHPDNNHYISIDNLLYDKGVTRLIACAPSATSTGTLILPSSIKAIEYSSLNYAKFTNIVLPGGLERIEYRSMICCSNLKSLIIPDSVTLFDSISIFGCRSLESVTIGKGIESDSLPRALDSMEFLYEILVSRDNQVYASADGVLYSKDFSTLHVFPAAKNIKHVTIPITVERLDTRPFSHCKSIESITFLNPVPATTLNNMEAFEWFCDTSLRAIYVPAGSVDDYRNSPHFITALSDMGLSTDIIQTRPSESGSGDASGDTFIPVLHDITANWRGAWRIGRGALEFVSRGLFDRFIGAIVDGHRLVFGKDFTVRSGSTILTLLPEYLETLSPGKHTLVVEFTDGRSEAEFVIESSATDVPDTGGSPLFPCASFLVSACLLIVLLSRLNLKRKRID